MINDILRALLEAALAGTAAIVLLLCLRHPLRARFRRARGLPGLAAGAAGDPGGVAAGPEPACRRRARGRDGGAVVSAATWSARAFTQAPIEAARLLASAWGAGVLASLCWYVLRQRRLHATAPAQGRQRLRHGVRPWPGRGRLVARAASCLPEDFRERYTRGEQRLVLAHEIAHLRRGDIHAQATATALRCLLWFNPLVHYAAGLFRFDQELACDATVLERFPRGRGRYGSAMLKTQLAGFGLPVGCHWRSSHPSRSESKC
jgi:hypothetical protein